MLKTLGLAALVTVGLSACAHKKISFDSQAAAEKAGVMRVSPTWLKEKGSKFDAQVILQNTSHSSQIVWLKDVTCGRGSVHGDTTMVNARHGDVPIAFHPLQQQTIIFTCALPGEIAGNYVINVSKVYENPSDDGRTIGKLLAKDLKIEFVDRSEH